MYCLFCGMESECAEVIFKHMENCPHNPNVALRQVKESAVQVASAVAKFVVREKHRRQKRNKNRRITSAVEVQHKEERKVRFANKKRSTSDTTKQAADTAPASVAALEELRNLAEKGFLNL